MRFIINNHTVNLNPSDFKKAEVSFTFLHGRKFKVSDKAFSLNEVIDAVTKEALKPGQDKDELREWASVFTDKVRKVSEGVAKIDCLVLPPCVCDIL